MIKKIILIVAPALCILLCLYFSIHAWLSYKDNYIKVPVASHQLYQRICLKEEDLEEMAVSILEEQMENAEKDYVSNTTMSMTKTDGKWIIDKSMKDDAAFLNAISGGMMDVAGDIANAKKGEDTEKDDK